jgi:hypothetical protein
MMRINRPEGRTADLSTPLRGTGGVMGLRPTQGDEKRLLSEAALPWERRPHPCHLDRSAAQWRDLCVDALSWKCFSTGAYPDFLPRCTGQRHLCTFLLRKGA